MRIGGFAILLLSLFLGNAAAAEAPAKTATKSITVYQDPG